MYDKIYLYSTDWGDGPDLIGTIIKDGDNYSFSYDKPEMEWYCIIKPYRDTRKVYGTEVVKSLFRRLIPEKDSKWTDAYLKQYNMTEYDEWELLIRFIKDSTVYFGKSDCTGNIYWTVELCGY